MLQPAPWKSRGRGQALVLFVLTLTALIGLTGLVIDGSSTYVQRRGMQNAADLAAMAAGYAYLNGKDITAAAIKVAQANGYTNGANQTTVSVPPPVSEDGGTAEQITVSITAPHQNWFSGIFGMSSWNVGTTATVQAGIPNQISGGALPLLFNEDLFSSYCPPVTSTTTPTPCTFNEPPSGPQSIPTDSASYFEFNWTVFCQASGNPCNANTNLVNGLITGTSPTTQVTISLGTDIDPLNAGSHTQLFTSLAALVPGCYPVAVVDGSGKLQGFATFCLTSSVGGATKEIAGYFTSGVNSSGLTIRPGGGTPQFFGAYAVYLTN